MYFSDANDYEESAASEETEGADEVSFEESENEELPVTPLADQPRQERIMTNDDMDLNLSGLSDEERRHILMVMNRANEMAFTPIKPLSPSMKTEMYSPRRAHSNKIEEGEEVGSTPPLSDSSIEDEEPIVRSLSARRKSSTLPVIEEPEDMDEEEWETECGLRYQYNRHPEDYNQTAVPIVVHPPSPYVSDEEKEFEDKDDNLPQRETQIIEKYNNYDQNDEQSYYDYSPDDNTSAGSPSEWNSENQFAVESFTAQIRTSIDLPDEVDMSEKCSPAPTPDEQDGYIEAEESFSAPLRQSFDIEEENDQYPFTDAEFDKINELGQQIDYEYDKYGNQNVVGSYVSHTDTDYYADPVSSNNYDNWSSANQGSINPNLGENYDIEQVNEETEDKNLNDDENYGQYDENQFSSPEPKPQDYTYKDDTEVSYINHSEPDWAMKNAQVYQESDPYNYDNTQRLARDEEDTFNSKLYSSASDNGYQSYYQEDKQYFTENDGNYDNHYKVDNINSYIDTTNEEFEQSTVANENISFVEVESFFDNDASELIDSNIGTGKALEIYDQLSCGIQDDTNYDSKSDKIDYDYIGTTALDTNAASSIYIESELTPTESNVSIGQKEKFEKSLEIDSGTDSVIGSFMMDEAELPETFMVDSECMLSFEPTEFLTDKSYPEKTSLSSAGHQSRLRSDSQSTEGPDENETYEEEDFSPTSDEPILQNYPIIYDTSVTEQDNQQNVSENLSQFNPVEEEFHQQKDKIVIVEQQNPTSALKNVDVIVPENPKTHHTQKTVSGEVTVSGRATNETTSIVSTHPVKMDANPINTQIDRTYIPPKKISVSQKKVEEKPKSSSFFGGSSMFNVKKFDLGGISSAIKSQTEHVIKKATSTNINILPTAMPSSAASSRKSSFADTQDDFGIDLAGLSAEEKEHILSVMAKANEATSVPVLAAPTIIPIINKPIVDSSYEARTEDVCQEDKRDTMVGFGVSYGSESSHETEDTGYASRNSPFEDEMYEFNHDQNFPLMHIPETIVEDKNWKGEVSSEPVTATEATYQRSAATYNPFLSEVEQVPHPNPIPEIVIPGMPDLDLSQFNEEERQHLLAMFFKANEMEHEIEEREVKQPVNRAGSTPQLPLLDRPIPVIREIQPTPEANVDYVSQFEQRFRDNSVTGSTESINKPSEELVSHLQQYDSSEVSSDINDDEEQQKRIRCALTQNEYIIR